MDSLCHPWFTTTNFSYRFPILETSATALCGTTGILSSPLVSHPQSVPPTLVLNILMIFEDIQSPLAVQFFRSLVAPHLATWPLGHFNYLFYAHFRIVIVQLIRFSCTMKNWWPNTCTRCTSFNLQTVLFLSACFVHYQKNWISGSRILTPEGVGTLSIQCRSGPWTEQRAVYQRFQLGKRVPEIWNFKGTSTGGNYSHLSFSSFAVFNFRTGLFF